MKKSPTLTSCFLLPLIDIPLKDINLEHVEVYLGDHNKNPNS